MDLDSSIAHSFAMDRVESELENLVRANPLEDKFRVQLESLLSVTDPNSIECQLLKLERRIADMLECDQPVEEQILEYRRFRLESSYHFGEMEGSCELLLRPFSLYVISCNPDRAFALVIAIQNKLNLSIQLEALPKEIARSMDVLKAFDVMNGIKEFVRVYKGPTGNEPEVTDDEFTIKMLPTYSKKYV